MNPPSFTGQSTTENLENFVEESKKLFEVMHVVNTHINRSVMLEPGLKNGRTTELRTHHLQVWIVSKKPSWEVLSLRNEGRKGTGVPHF